MCENKVEKEIRDINLETGKASMCIHAAIPLLEEEKPPCSFTAAITGGKDAIATFPPL